MIGSMYNSKQIFKNYNDQYNYSKNALINAISSNHNIILYGTGGNGKSHIINELNTYLKNNKYFIIKELIGKYNVYDWNNYLKNNNIDKWIVCINDEKLLFTMFSQSYYVFINMNGYVWPDNAMLRSGKSISRL